MTDDDLKSLVDPANMAVKVSRRDFPLVLSKNLHGGTTVAATMFIANKVGIPIFVTGTDKYEICT